MEATTALLRIAARAVQASAAVVAGTHGDAPVAAWGCDASAARALVAAVRRSPNGRRIALVVPLSFADGSAGELLLATPCAEPDVAAVTELAREIGALTESSASPEVPSELAGLADTIERLGEAVAIVEIPLGKDEPTRIVSVNGEFAELFGYGRDVVGSPARILWGPLTDRDGLTQLRTRMEVQATTRSNAVLYARDGSPRWIELVSTPAGPGAERHHVIVYRDVTSRKMIVDALAAEKQKLETTLGAIGEAVVTVMADGIVDYVNEAAETLLGVTLGDVYGAHVSDVLRLVDADAVALDLPAGCRDGVVRGRAILSTESGSADIEYVASQIDREHGTVIVLRDVTTEHRLALRLSFEAAHDPLTGLQNRRAFLERLEDAIHGARERGEHHALAFLDLDRFKIVNDRFGHATGDRLLAEVGRVMGRVVRGGDVLARIGGDEFACLLSNCRLTDARRVAEKLRAAVDGYRIFHEGESLKIGVSIGLAAIENDVAGAETVMEEADAACYQAKAAGRNTIQG